MTAPLRVLLDARMLIGRFSGVGRFVTSLVDELARHDDTCPIVLCGREPFLPWSGRDDIEIIRSTFGRYDRSPRRRLIWEETRLRSLIRRANADVFHATWNHGIPLRCPIPAVLTIHDLIPWNQPVSSGRAALDRWCYRRAVRTSAFRASRVTTVSEYVRRQVFSKLNIPSGRAETIYNGVETPAATAHVRRKTRYPFILYVGGHEARKNVAGVCRTMQHYWSRFGPDIELHLTGHPTDLTPDAASALQQLDQGDRVRFHGHLAEPALRELYRSASALLFLSRDEGFGLPVLEAMAYGCPVIAANASSIPEVAADAAILVDPDNCGAAAEAIHSLVEDEAVRAMMIRRGHERAASFSWSATAAQFRETYAAAVSTQISRCSGHGKPVETGSVSKEGWVSRTSPKGLA